MSAGTQCSNPFHSCGPTGTPLGPLTCLGLVLAIGRPLFCGQLFAVDKGHERPPAVLLHCNHGQVAAAGVGVPDGLHHALHHYGGLMRVQVQDGAGWWQCTRWAGVGHQPISWPRGHARSARTCAAATEKRRSPAAGPHMSAASCKHRIRAGERLHTHLEGWGGLPDEGRVCLAGLPRAGRGEEAIRRGGWGRRDRRAGSHAPACACCVIR